MCASYIPAPNLEGGFMKNIVSLAALMMSTSAFATSLALPNPVAVINANPEVKSAIETFESHRGQKCNRVDFSNTSFRRDNTVKSVITCNQYDENGNAQANVHQITIRGRLYRNFFDLESFAIVARE